MQLLGAGIDDRLFPVKLFFLRHGFLESTISIFEVHDFDGRLLQSLLLLIQVKLQLLYLLGVVDGIVNDFLIRLLLGPLFLLHLVHLRIHAILENRKLSPLFLVFFVYVACNTDYPLHSLRTISYGGAGIATTMWKEQRRFGILLVAVFRTPTGLLLATCLILLRFRSIEERLDIVFDVV